jgi:hypothetical protein
VKRDSIRRLLAAAWLVCVPLALGCAKASSVDGATAAGGSGIATSVVVENQNYLDHRVYVENDVGLRVRLGNVAGNSVAEFRIPDSFVANGQQIRFVCVPIASPDRPTTQNIVINRGDQITIRITP